MVKLITVSGTFVIFLSFQPLVSGSFAFAICHSVLYFLGSTLKNLAELINLTMWRPFLYAVFYRPLVLRLT